MSLVDKKINIAGLTFKNRLVKSATAESMSDGEGFISDQYLRFYERLAEGGASLIITGNIFASKEGRTSLSSPLLDEDAKIGKFKSVTEAVHKNDCRIFAQIDHGGREALSPQAPSAARNSLTMVKPRAMTESGIVKAVSGFRKSAARAKAAGFDGIQIHAAHGHLVSQFLSSRTNRRKDKWGGRTIGERMRFLLEVYGGIREEAGPDFPIILKLNGQDYVKNGLNTEEAIYVAKKLEAEGLNAVEISGGTIESGFYTIRGGVPIKELLRNRNFFIRTFGYFKLKGMAGKAGLREGYNLHEAGEIKKALNIPVIGVGGMRTKVFIEEALRKNTVDMAALARPLIREPFLPKKILDGSKDKADCVSCNLCFAVRGPLKCQLISHENERERQNENS